MTDPDDARWLAAAARLAARARPASRPNPAVGALIVKAGRVIARGWTQPTGRPHAEAMALTAARTAAGDAARGATLYVTLEPCAHISARGDACADKIIAAGIARVVAGAEDPDPRTAGAGFARLAAAGVTVTRLALPEVAASLVGYFTRARLGRPHVTLKLATSLDGRIALGNGESRWITGPAARAQTMAMRARMDAICVGAGTWRADNPRLDVRLPGLEAHTPERWLLSRALAARPEDALTGWRVLASPAAIIGASDAQYLLVEGGAGAAAAFLAEDLVDTLMLYRAPIILGSGPAAVRDIGLAALDAAHGRWVHAGHQVLGADSLDIYHAVRQA